MLAEKISNKLPFEILCLIFKNTEIPELLIFSKVCMDWNQAALSFQLWEHSTLDITPNSNFKLNFSLMNRRKDLFQKVKSFRTTDRIYPPQFKLVFEFLPYLTRIQFNQCGLSSELLISIIQNYSKTLKDVDFSRNREVTDAVLRAMSNCHQLQAVCLSSCMNFSSSALSNLIINRRLSHIVLQKLYNLSENDLTLILDALLQNAFGIRFLDVSFNHHLITISALEKLCSLFKMKHEVLLNVSNCEQLVRKDVEKLQKRFPLAKIIHNTVLYDYSVESIKHYLDFVLAN